MKKTIALATIALVSLAAIAYVAHKASTPKVETISSVQMVIVDENEYLIVEQ